MLMGDQVSEKFNTNFSENIVLLIGAGTAIFSKTTFKMYQIDLFCSPEVAK